MTNVEYKRFQFRVALDNHEPTRSFANGEGFEYVHPTTGKPGIKIPNAESTFKDAFKSVYLIDDGNAVVPHYVAGHSPRDEPETVFLHAFPTNPNGERREDNGRVIDFSSWWTGPLRAYHLKITRG